MLFNFQIFLFIMIYIFSFIFPIGICDLYTVDNVKSTMILALLIGIVIYNFKDLKKVFLGGYKWIVKKDNSYYKQISHLYFMVLIFLIHLLFFLFDFLYIKIQIFLSCLMLSILNVIDGNKDLEDLTKKEYLLFSIYLILGGILKQTSIFILLFCKLIKLNCEESYNIFIYNLVVILLFRFVKIPSLMNINYLLIFVIGIILSYITTFLFHYLHSLNRLKIIGVIASLFHFIFIIFFII